MSDLNQWKLDDAKAHAIADAKAEASRGGHRSLKEYKFCESCAMSLEFCDCVSPKPIDVYR